MASAAGADDPDFIEFFAIVFPITFPIVFSLVFPLVFPLVISLVFSIIKPQRSGHSMRMHG